MLVIAALVAATLGQVASVASLVSACVVSLVARHPIALMPAVLAGLWIWGTVDFVDMVDGPLRIDADANLLGTGRAPPAALTGANGPVWWIPTASATLFALFTRWPAVPNLRAVAVIGLACLAVTYLGYAALDAMY